VDGKDDGFTAVEIVDETIRRGCNPGDGSERVQRLPARVHIPDGFKNRLLGQDEVAHLNAGARIS
jgi:hypothetical protein